MAAAPSAPVAPKTLAVDVGGSKLKAAVLGPDGAMASDRVRTETTFPMPPDHLVDGLVALVEPLPAFDRAAVGFPGMVRKGVVLTAPNLVTKHGPGTKVDPTLVEAWAGFDLAGALARKLGVPTLVANDADVQGAAVVLGKGLELVVTLGTGFGTALFSDGALVPHLELAHHPLADGETYEGRLGNVAREQAGNKKWSKRVLEALRILDALLFFDHVYVGGGNAKHLTVELGPKATIVDNRAGILGGVKLWERAG